MDGMVDHPFFCPSVTGYLGYVSPSQRHAELVEELKGTFTGNPYI